MKMIAKRTVLVDGKRTEYALDGRGTPAIVLINGGGGPIEGWHKVYHALAEKSAVFAYNRAGIGKSAKPEGPQDGETIVAALRGALNAVGVKPPYLLVGHSLGGLYANLYARLHPEETVGVVLLEASHPGDLAIGELQSGAVRGANKLLRLMDALIGRRKWHETNEVAQTAAQIARAGAFPDVPLVVVSGGKRPPMMPEAVYDVRRDNQTELARLSARGRQIVAAGSGHFPQFSEPALVVSAIEDCLEEARSRQNREVAQRI
ncbi:alpha/beta fold hydrolase [Cohnella sp. JJ-181]|uniref:alpha/beta fold hydrolase n=1 Tax=Cohnella rhizoplanae TaxID=2974897 RepID=UPI0022FFAC2E|nr:alpha/beta hydrolase [Cohnella sp. JJ-181]CAI6023223.1 2-succinyl-6-hydroxy-2, 4-cyclohexadiene-1-carboxylate synthase [Cohnella sp. JJ-181]